MTTHRTHCAVRLGDNLAHLHFLRKLAQVYPDHRFIHYCHLNYIHQLAEVVCDLPNLQLCDLECVSDVAADYWTAKPRELLCSVDGWKNAAGKWETDAQRNDYAIFMLRHFETLAAEMGLTSPLQTADDLRFDYPALNYWKFPEFDVLVVNSVPQSGQMPRFHPAALENLVGELSQRCSVITTAPTRFNAPCTQTRNMTVSQVGALSRFCRYIVMVSTGPSWPTFNVFNVERVEFRLVLIESERVNISPNTEHARSADEARKILQLRGIL